MYQKAIKWLRIQYEKTVTSIAFYPILIALAFLAISIFMVSLDFSETGKDLKSQLDWVRLKDASTARSIISAIAAGIISLTVFSFSMVMIVLNQAASQMSNRVLDNLIGNRFQQLVLGIYIGTIVYALFLLSTIRDIDSGIYIPALSIYLLIGLTIIDIFLFIYFLHYITDSVKYDTIIHRIYEQTLTSMKATCRLDNEPSPIKEMQQKEWLDAPASGVFQGFDKSALLHFCEAENIVISFLYPVGTFVVEGTPYASISKKMSDEQLEALYVLINIHRGDSIDKSFYYGIRQLSEIAVKALSPGINDPGTAIQSVRALTGLMVYRIKHFPDNEIKDDKGNLRILTKEKSFEEIFEFAFYPIWEYGKKDIMLRDEMNLILKQLMVYGPFPVIKKLLQVITSEMSVKLP